MLTVKRRAIESVLVAEYRSLIRYSQRLTSNGSEAMDLVQMVCARVLAQQTLETIDTWPDNMSAWLRTILFRLFIDSRRRAKWEIPTDAMVLDRPASAQAPDPEAFSAGVEDVRALLVSLPMHYRVPYELFTFEHVSYEGIAARLGLSCNTVATRINRARKRLRILLQPVSSW
jgi:RNA polymerase sigma-70 factor (ECF subfamily)